MGHESIESEEYFNREFPEGCQARETQFLKQWITDAFHAGVALQNSGAVANGGETPTTNIPMDKIALHIEKALESLPHGRPGGRIESFRNEINDCVAQLRHR